MTPISIAGYLALFVGVGLVFLFANLLVGRFLRPDDPHAEKLEVYECGEPTIGSSFVQFDLRFYVVALLFIIFDVEVAFFFPWANVFGKSTQLKDPYFAAAVVQRAQAAGGDQEQIQQTANSALVAKFGEMGVTPPTIDRVLAQPSGDARENAAAVRSLASDLAKISIFDIGVFFAVLMVGFFYVWRRGDLDWVRAVGRERSGQVERGPPVLSPEEAPALSA